jgi:hypothetical protein
MSEPSAVVEDHACGSRVGFLGVCLLLVVAPFETARPLLTLPGQSISSVELAIASVIAVWLAATIGKRVSCALRFRPGVAGHRRRANGPAARTEPAALIFPWAVLIGAMLLAALVAPTDRANALHMVGRLGVAFVIYFIAKSAVTTSAGVSRVMLAAGLSGVVAGSLVVAEFWGLDPVLDFLRLFRPAPAVVGAQMRAGGPFQYPTIASMYLEIVFALVLAFIPAAFQSRTPLRAAALLVLLLLIAEAIALTFTRAGLLTMLVSLAIVGGVRAVSHGVDRGVLGVAVVGAGVVLATLLSRSGESLWLRLTSQEQSGWYGALVEAPSHLEIAAGAVTTLPVTLTNTGRSSWVSDARRPFSLTYHWLTESNHIVEWEGRRTPLPTTIAPGQRVTLEASVAAPSRPGRYHLLWDVFQEHGVWFSTEPDASWAISRASVTGSATGEPRDTSRILDRRRPPPGRWVLWRAAGQMLAERPLTGVGPDNFRLRYGEFAGLAEADPRIHSNNMYVEMVAGGGLIGGLAFLWFCGRAARRTVRVVRGASGLGPDASRFESVAGREAVAAGLAAAIAAVAVHGLVDAFLSFTPVYVLVAVTLGLSDAHYGGTDPDAYRV